MKVADFPFINEDIQQLEANEFYKLNQESLKKDFTRTFHMLNETEMSDDLTDQQKIYVSKQKTDLFIAFCSGHLNFFDVHSNIFKAMNKRTGGEEKTDSGLILPPSEIIR